MTTLEQEQVLYEDNHLIAINKKSGDISQGDKTGDAPLGEYVKGYIKAKYNKPGEVFLGVIHRLDRPTSGVILFARTSKALTRMTKLFKTRDVQKTYWAVVRDSNLPAAGTCDNFLWKNEKQNKSYVVDEKKPGAKKALLHYKVIKTDGAYQLIEIQLETGRHHQIRVQLSALGAPIIGDNKYGYKRANRDQSIHLHCRYTAFEHPVKKEPLQITAPLPDDVIWNRFR